MHGIKQKIVLLFVGADTILLLVVALFFDKATLLNTQIGFLSASIVMLGSMQSYQRMVHRRLAQEMITTDIEKDVIDTIEDPHALYEEHEENPKVTIKEERDRYKAQRRSWGETLHDSKTSLSPYRIGAYIILIVGFFYLNRMHLLHIPSYLFGLSLPLLLILLPLVSELSHIKQETNL